MKDFIPPNFEEDKVSPKNIDYNRLLKMLSYLIAFIFCVYLFFYSILYFFIWWFSIEDEKRVFWNMFIEKSYKKLDLNNLSKKIEIDHNVYISDSKEINAYATLWWNIIFTKAIMDSFVNEEEFIFVLWHEITHIENRDIMQYYSKQMPFYTSMLLLWFDFDFNIVANYFSQDTEIKADKWWLKFLKKHWYNSDCVIWFFEKENNIFNKYLNTNINSTHPSDEKRLKQIKKFKSNSDLDCTELNIK